MAKALASEEKLIEDHLYERRMQLALSTAKRVRWSAVGLICLSVLLWLAFPRYSRLLAFAGSAVVVVIGTILYSILDRRGQYRLGIYLLLAGILFPLAVLPMVMPEIMLAVSVGYVFLAILGSMLLGHWDSRWLAVVCVLAFVTGVVVKDVLELSWFAPLDRRASMIVAVLPSAFVLLGAIVVVRLLVKEQEEALRQSRRANLRVDRRARMEQEKSAYLSNTVQEYAEYMAEVGQGNLARRLSLDGDGRKEDDPLLTLGHSLNEMVDELRRMMIRIQESTGSLGSSAAEILAATIQQVSGAGEQSAAISQTNTTVEEVKTIAEQSVASAQEVSDGAQRAVKVSRRGQQALQEMIDGMAQIKTRVEAISENILALSEQTQQIGEIVDVVNEIASQSNLLALNASIEAARAGDQGKGFAVVAMEVRDLAQQSQAATEQIKEILSEIQKATASTVLATEEGVKGTDLGVRLAAQAGEVIGQLASAIDESAHVAMRMAAGGRQQSAGMSQVALSMQNISQAMTQSLASTRQAEQAAQDLNGLANSLSELVEQYQL